MDKEAPASISDLFERLGGTGAAARAMSVGQSTASEMKRRGSIPVSYWPSLMRAAEAKSFPLNEASLVAMHVAPADKAEVAA